MDSALVQTLLAGAIVLGALAFVARRAWRTVSAARTPKGGSACGGPDCGCGH